MKQIFLLQRDLVAVEVVFGCVSNLYAAQSVELGALPGIVSFRGDRSAGSESRRGKSSRRDILSERKSEDEVDGQKHPRHLKPTLNTKFSRFSLCDRESEHRSNRLTMTADGHRETTDVFTGLLSYPCLD